MTYQGFCAALEKKCKKEGININLLDLKALYLEFECLEDWKCMDKLIHEKVCILNKSA